MDCYNEYGSAAYVKVTEGKVVAKDGGEIKVVYAANTDATKVEVTKEAQGTIETGLTIVKPVADSNASINRETEAGIPLAYSIDGSTATEEQIEEREAQVGVLAEEAVETAITEDIIDQGIAEQKHYVARIGTTPYESFNAAANAAKPGEKITLIDNFTLEYSIGTEGVTDYDHYYEAHSANEVSNLGAVKGGLKNEVVLSKDITITFANGAKIYLAAQNDVLGEKGSINLNGHKLFLSAGEGGNSVLGAGVVRCNSIGSNYEVNSEKKNIEIKTNLEFDHEHYLYVDYAMSYAGEEWETSGNPVISAGKLAYGTAPSDNPIFVSSKKLPRYNSTAAKYDYNDERHVWLTAPSYVADEDEWGDDIDDILPPPVAPGSNQPVSLDVDDEVVEYSFNWTYEVVSGDLNVRIVKITCSNDITNYVNEHEDFRQLFSDSTIQYGQYQTSICGFGDLSSGDAYVDILGGTGEILITATGTAEGEEPVTYTWRVIVY